MHYLFLGARLGGSHQKAVFVAVQRGRDVHFNCFCYILHVKSVVGLLQTPDTSFSSLVVLQKMSDDDLGAGGAPQADVVASSLPPAPDAAAAVGSTAALAGVGAAGVDAAVAAATANIYSYRGWGKDGSSTSASSNGRSSSSGSGNSGGQPPSWRDPPPPPPPAAPSYDSLHATVSATAAADNRSSGSGSSSSGSAPTTSDDTEARFARLEVGGDFFGHCLLECSAIFREASRACCRCAMRSPRRAVPGHLASTHTATCAPELQTPGVEP